MLSRGGGALLALLAFIFAACDDGSGSSGGSSNIGGVTTEPIEASELIGTWTASNGTYTETLEFKSETEVTYSYKNDGDNDSTIYNGTYTINGSIVTIECSNANGGSISSTFTYSSGLLVNGIGLTPAGSYGLGDTITTPQLANTTWTWSYDNDNIYLESYVFKFQAGGNLILSGYDEGEYKEYNCTYSVDDGSTVTITSEDEGGLEGELLYLSGQLIIRIGAIFTKAS